MDNIEPTTESKPASRAAELRGIIERLLRAERPNGDFSDDEQLYGQILEDYEDYARLLDDEGARLERQKEIDEANKSIEAAIAAAERGDGVPRLFGRCNRFGSEVRSIFDIARGI